MGYIAQPEPDILPGVLIVQRRELDPNMAVPTTDINALARAGVSALQSGDAQGARDLLVQATATGRANAMAWLNLAAAQGGVGDGPAKLAALDKALALEPANIAALIMKADHLHDSGQAMKATPFYRAALRTASGMGQLPPDTIRKLQHAESRCEQAAKQYEDYLHGKLAAVGFKADDNSRFAQSLDLMFGRKRIFQQEPSVFYFPELPQKQFFAREDFPWLDSIETATDDIRAELVEVMKQDGAFVPYIESDPARPPRDYQGLADSLNWSAFYLWKNGAVVPENAARCPRTVAALEAAPLDRIARRTPSVLFSLLRPGAKIPPHHGFINTRLICHLPLIVPDGCGFRVGNDVRAWKEGKAWVFDDTIEHEAWNNSGETRVILLFDIWRPEFSANERKLVAAMLEAVATYGDNQQEWTV